MATAAPSSAFDLDRDQLARDLPQGHEARGVHLPAEHLSVPGRRAWLLSPRSRSCRDRGRRGGVGHAALLRCGVARHAPALPQPPPALHGAADADEAAITPNLACVRAQLTEILDQCAYGVPADEAVETVALLGDSHGAHWRAALDVVAQRKHWRVLEVGRPHCPFTSRPRLRRAGVVAVRAVEPRCGPGWPATRRSDLFVTANAQAPLVVPEGNTDTRRASPATWTPGGAAGVGQADRGDPRQPDRRTRTHDCVRRAIRRHEAAGWAPDAAPGRAPPTIPPSRPRTGCTSGRPGSIDLTRYLLRPPPLFPRVGGVLVHKDVDHLRSLRADARTVPAPGHRPPPAPAGGGPRWR